MIDAIARITQRHRRVDRPHQHLLTDDPREVIRYLRGCGSAGLLEDDESHDLEDLLVLRVFLWWEGQAAEKWALEAVETLAFDRKRAGRPLGIRTGQGVHDRLDRLIGLFSPARRPHQRVARIERGTAVGSALPPPATPPQLDGTTLRSALAAVLDHLDDFPEDLIEDLVPLRRETGRWAQLSDRELVNDLRLVLLDVDEVELPGPARRAVDALSALVRV